MAVLIFFWIWSLPLLMIAAFFAMPSALILLPLSLALSLWMQYIHHDKIMPEHFLRKYLSYIPWNEWFPCNTLTFEEQAVIAVHPHGLLCCGAVVGIHFVPGSKTVLCVAPILFYVPVIGWCLRLLGCIPAHLHIMRETLRRGFSVVVVPGGVPEIVCAETSDNRKRFPRHGFLRLASSLNMTVYAVYVEGECQTFRLIPMPFLEKRIYWSWRLNVPLVFPLVIGWYGLWLPKRVPLLLKKQKIEHYSKEHYQSVLDSLMMRI